MIYETLCESVEIPLNLSTLLSHAEAVVFMPQSVIVVQSVKHILRLLYRFKVRIFLKPLG